MTKIIKTDQSILVLNAGSATLKWALFRADDLTEMGRGVIERIGENGSFAEWRLQGKLSIKQLKFRNHDQAVFYVIKMLAWHKLLPEINIVGHRIVHGGSKFDAPVKLTVAVIKSLANYNALAPLHNPVQLRAAAQAIRLLPRAKQLGVFGTAWFNHLPAQSRIYALPEKLTKKYGLKRFGFHGLSHAYVAEQAAKILSKSLSQLNLITCHLGNGCSVTAIRQGKPIDTSMGFTPLEGLIMGTRSGDIDPGLLLYLAKRPGMTIKKLDFIINQESGLKGLAGTNDMREVMTMAGYEVRGFKLNKKITATDRQNAKLAFSIWLYHLQKYIGAYAAILGRVDGLVFTGGIGERNEVVRNLTMQGLPTLKNIPVLAIPTNEELAIAREITKFI